MNVWSGSVIDTLGANGQINNNLNSSTESITGGVSNEIYFSYFCQQKKIKKIVNK